MSIREDLIQRYVEQFGEKPQVVVRAPGRVNLIGEHTDYNDGFVMPLAIDRAVWLALRPTGTEAVRIRSLDFDAPIYFDLNRLEKAPSSPAEYVKGIAWALQQAGYALKGFEGVMKGDVPIGAGLSSSAALELAAARAFASVSNLPWDQSQMALLAQKAENSWVGVNSGIMDQMISATGQPGQAVLIDCRSLALEAIPLPEDTAVIVLDTGTRRELVTSAYNERREQCEKAARHFGVAKLRDVSLDQFEVGYKGLDDVTMRRARHVISENERVQLAKAAMVARDTVRLGQLLNESHISLRDDFEVSSDALNTIVRIAQVHPGCYGARMTGAGFGGCGVALVKPALVGDFVEYLRVQYQRETPHSPAIYVCEASSGAEVVA
ncbi:MAG: galactokinase [Anaerolineae bacterium]|nr:galactokinase [Anaerolineae bacterium]